MSENKHESGGIDGALKHCDQTLKINPQYDSAWHNKGCCWINIGIHDEAYRCFDRALEINPAYQDARKNRDVVLNMMKNKG